MNVVYLYSLHLEVIIFFLNLHIHLLSYIQNSVDQ